MIMSKEIRADYDSQYLLPPSVEDWVSRDHPARFIREFVEMLDLSELGFRLPEGETGRPHYGADLLLKIWLYGYLEGIRSSRRLEKGCLENMSLIWLTGNNAPDHNTIWRFFKANSQALRGVFRQSVKVAINAGLVGLALHAVDGTSIKAKGSRRSVLSRKQVESLLKDLDKSVGEMMDEVAGNEALEADGCRLPEELSDREALRSRLRDALERMDEIDRNYFHPVEPDARMMKNGVAVEPCYNGQVVVDEESGMIVAEDIVNEENDKKQLVPMVEKVEENVGRAADETLADGGYFSVQALSEAEERDYGVLVNVERKSRDRGRDEFQRSNFTYVESEDCVMCPLGKRLEYCYTDNSKNPPRRRYQCREFRDCPRRWECSRSKKGRMVMVSQEHRVLKRQKEKQLDDTMKALLRKRGAIVEKTFGSIKEGMQFRRLTVAGLDNVKAQWSIICTAFNLRKLYKQWLLGNAL
jgi:transposase